MVLKVKNLKLVESYQLDNMNYEQTIFVLSNSRIANCDLVFSFSFMHKKKINKDDIFTEKRRSFHIQHAVKSIKQQSDQPQDILFIKSANPLLSVIVDNEWRKESFKNVNIFIPEGAKLTINNDGNDAHEPSLKFPVEKVKEWNDIGLHELLGKYTDIKDIDKKDK